MARAQPRAACDNLVSVELVTADGSTITASANEHPDLFWGAARRGGNFGVATALTFRLHPVGPEVLAGLLLYDADKGADLMRVMRDVLEDAPDEFGPAAAYLTALPEDVVPQDLHGRLVSALALCYTGPIDEGARTLDPFRALGPEADLVGPVPYADFQCSIDDPIIIGDHPSSRDDYGRYAFWFAHRSRSRSTPAPEATPTPSIVRTVPLLGSRPGDIRWLEKSLCDLHRGRRLYIARDKSGLPPGTRATSEIHGDQSSLRRPDSVFHGQNSRRATLRWPGSTGKRIDGSPGRTAPDAGAYALAATIPSRRT